LHHLAFHASNRQQVDSFFDFLVENDITILDPPAEYDYTPGYYAVFFSDPDGMKLEVVYEPNSASVAT
jgi:catechol 2,3-dioxygenase-like lactoylglutathione lyase family enzyme